MLVSFGIQRPEALLPRRNKFLASELPEKFRFSVLDCDIMLEQILNPANYSFKGLTLLFPIISVAIVLQNAWLLYRERLKIAYVAWALLGFAIVLWTMPTFFFNQCGA